MTTLYSPKVEVRLIKAARRKQLVEGRSVAQRYNSVVAIDLTPYLGESGGVQTNKSVRQPVGGFSVTLVDKPYRDRDRAVVDSLYALIEPMDMVEIRMCRHAFDPSNKRGRPPVVMRGLVSEVRRSASMASGRPQRTVVVSGHDMGKVLQLLQIFYLNNSVVGDNLLTEMGFFSKYGEEGQAKLKPASDFVADVLKNVINPYLGRIIQFADGASVDAKVINQWEPNISLSGVVSPYAVAQFNNVSLYQMLASLLDVGPFNELFVEDTEDGVQLTARPAPFLDVNGNPLQGVSPEVVSVPSSDVVSIDLTRSDSGVANYYWVSNSAWSMYSNETAQMLASVGPESSFILFGYENCRSDLYGIRKMEVTASLLPPGYAASDSASEAQVAQDTGTLGGWIEQRRKLLADINKDNSLFEFGTLRVKGWEAIKAGMELRLTQGVGKVASSYYVTGVSHDINPVSGNFTSTLTVERGTSFINRLQQATSAYWGEVDARGVQ